MIRNVAIGTCPGETGLRAKLSHRWISMLPLRTSWSAPAENASMTSSPSSLMLPETITSRLRPTEYSMTSTGPSGLSMTNPIIEGIDRHTPGPVEREVHEQRHDHISVEVRQAKRPVECGPLEPDLTESLVHSLEPTTKFPVQLSDRDATATIVFVFVSVSGICRLLGCGSTSPPGSAFRRG
jgi:hypothetical protein